MHDEPNFIKQLKYSSEIIPSKEFVEETRLLLLDEEEKYLKKKKLNKLAFFAISLLTSLAVVLWVSFGGTSFLFQSFINTGIFASTDSVGKNTNPSIFIYHTHSRESFMSEIGETKADLAHSKKVNIGLVGERLAQSLEKNGVTVQHEKRDFISELNKKNLEYSQSYEISRGAVEEILKKNKGSLDMILDVHRDSQKREITTLESEGKTYGRVAFFVSANLDNFEEVKSFAVKIHKQLEEVLPGLSRGVFIKSSSQGNTQSTYNQDLFDQSLSFNLGGAGNTLEEEYRTADVLAKVLSEIQEER